MTAPTAHDANPYLASEAAARLLIDLRQATDGRTGDRLSAAIRAVTSSGSRLPSDQVDAAIAAIALLLTEYEPTLLDGAKDEQGLRAWLHNASIARAWRHFMSGTSQTSSTSGCASAREPAAGRSAPRSWSCSSTS